MVAGELNLMGKTFSESKEKDGALFIYVCTPFPPPALHTATRHHHHHQSEVFTLLGLAGWAANQPILSHELSSRLPYFVVPMLYYSGGRQ